ncbi:MAG: right-handed parallel beta-helix repeat-containing protein [Actinomycetota bacterium]|nr:right-handed parallel beta-helix repeat-containing protein [Actinomycetota bacterium]
MDETGSETTSGGIEVTDDLTLEADLTRVGGPALVITVDNATVDLGGHTVRGSGEAGMAGAGILFRGVSGATVRNGTVTRFDAGVVIDGGSANVVENLTVEDNVGSPDGELGDGIVVNNSGKNEVRANIVRRNGPFSGISLGPSSTANEVRENIVADNNMAHLGASEVARQTMGIRIEGPAANHNRIVANTVTGSGADGIVVLATCDNPADEPPCVGTPPNEHNEIIANTASDNGRSGRGAGVRIFSMPLPIPPAHNILRDNVADDNANYGIAIDAAALFSPGNTATGNRGHGNGEFDGSDGTLMPPCGHNHWEDNDFGSVNQPGVARRSDGSAPSGG